MIEIREVKLDLENRLLYVVAEIPDKPAFENVFINEIRVGTQKTYNVDSEYIENAFYKEVVFDAKEYGKQYKSYKWAIDVDFFAKETNQKINLESDLFFVTVDAIGEINTVDPEGNPIELECGEDKDKVVGMAYNEAILYKNSLCMLSTEDVCNPSLDFLRYVVLYNAFKLSLESGNFDLAIKFWEDLTRCYQKGYQLNSSKCSCNG